MRLFLAGLAFAGGWALHDRDVVEARAAAVEAQEIARDFAAAAEACLASVDRYLEPIPHDWPACRPLMTTRENP